jgi:hypothetical protein
MLVYVVTVNGGVDLVFAQPKPAEAYADRQEADGKTVGVEICRLVETPNEN